jgi:hypothetical protein
MQGGRKYAFWLLGIVVFEAPIIDGQYPVVDPFKRNGRKRITFCFREAIVTTGDIRKMRSPDMALAVSMSASSKGCQAAGRNFTAFSNPAIQRSQRISPLRLSTAKRGA